MWYTCLISCSHQLYMSGPSAPKAHIDDVSLNGSHETRQT
ncbi:hypothetical protein AVEN_78434-1, partial [Araneus ventricosus]